MSTQYGNTDTQPQWTTIPPDEFQKVVDDDTQAMSKVDLELPYGDFTPELQAIIDEALKHDLTQAVIVAKTTKAMEGLLRFNSYMFEQFVETMKRNDVTATRAAGWPCEDVCNRFKIQRQNRPFAYLNTLEDRLAVRVINLAVKLPAVDRQKGSSNFILRLFSSDTWKIKQTADDSLPMPKSAGATPFGLTG